jgi:hypothetical protein
MKHIMHGGFYAQKLKYVNHELKVNMLTTQ